MIKYYKVSLFIWKVTLCLEVYYSKYFIYLYFFLWRYSPNLGLGLSPWNSRFTSFFYILQTVGRTPWAGDQLVARPLPVHKHRKTHTYTQTLNTHALIRRRTHDPGFRASEERAFLRPLGYHDRLYLYVKALNGISHEICYRYNNYTANLIFFWSPYFAFE
jgi:hypothetical protein